MQLILYFLQQFGALQVIQTLLVSVGVIVVLAIILRRS